MRLVKRHGPCVMLTLIAALAPMTLRAKTIVVYGASGAIGGLIVSEALSRGQTVIGVSRDPSKLKFENKNFKAAAGDATDLASFTSITKGADAVIISIGGVGSDNAGNAPDQTPQAQVAKIAVQAFTGVRNSPYVVQIGGSTILYPTKAEMEKNMIGPPEGEQYAKIFGSLVALQTYQASRIRWTMLATPRRIIGHHVNAPPDAHRTGKYRTSTTGFVKDANGVSQADIADVAVAAVDEAEHPRFVGKLFTIGY